MSGAFSRFAVWLGQDDNVSIILACAVAPPLAALCIIGLF